MNAVKRQAVATWFAGIMTNVLSSPKNMRKGGWHHLSDLYLLRRARQELAELEEALADPEGNAERIGKECADVANFVMMIADNSNRRGSKPSGE